MIIKLCSNNNAHITIVLFVLKIWRYYPNKKMYRELGYINHIYRYSDICKFNQYNLIFTHLRVISVYCTQKSISF